MSEGGGPPPTGSFSDSLFEAPDGAVHTSGVQTHDLGYLTVLAAQALHKGQLKPGDKQMKAGRLGTIEIQGDNILLGKPFIFTKENIDQFDF